MFIIFEVTWGCKKKYAWVFISGCFKDACEVSSTLQGYFKESLKMVQGASKMLSGHFKTALRIYIYKYDW